MSPNVPEKGEPGQPGQEGQEGSPPGGTGGRGGRGGTGKRGRRGVPGRTSIFPLIGYLILVTGILSGFYFQFEISERNAKAITALCEFKSDLGIRIKASQDFIEENPQGIPGIPISVIKSSLRNMQKSKTVFDKTLKGECRAESP